jgi:hypothetical protein
MLKSGDCTLTGADFAAGCLLCETAAMSQANPFRVFVTHAWDNSDDYLRVFEYLESANNFFYKNCSTPDHMPAGDKDALRESLRQQIAPAEVIIALPSLADANRELLQFQMIFAQAAHKPVVLMKKPIAGRPSSSNSTSDAQASSRYSGAVVVGRADCGERAITESICTTVSAIFSASWLDILRTVARMASSPRWGRSRVSEQRTLWNCSRISRGSSSSATADR